VVAGLLNRLITLSTRFAPRRMNSLIFGKAVGGMLKNVPVGSGAKKPVAATDARIITRPS
jgi:hypothetical protein